MATEEDLEVVEDSGGRERHTAAETDWKNPVLPAVGPAQVFPIQPKKKEKGEIQNGCKKLGGEIFFIWGNSF